MKLSYLKQQKYRKMQEVLTNNFGGASCKHVQAIWERDYTSLTKMAEDFKVHINQLNVILSHKKLKTS